MLHMFQDFWQRLYPYYFIQYPQCLYVAMQTLYFNNVYVISRTCFFNKERLYKEPTFKAKTFKEVVLLKIKSLRNFSFLDIFITANNGEL